MQIITKILWISNLMDFYMTVNRLCRTDSKDCHISNRETTKPESLEEFLS